MCWPVWEWTFKPWTSWVFATYAQGLSTEHSTNRRTLIQSNWYQERYGDRYQLAKDENLKTQFRNTSRGQMFATSFGGSVTGFGGERILCLCYNSEITTRQGYFQIGYLVEKRLPLEVATFNHDTSKIEFVPIERFEKSASRDLVQIDLGDRVLECTEDHPIWIEGKGYIPAVQIKVGDVVLTHDKDLCFL